MFSYFMKKSLILMKSIKMYEIPVKVSENEVPAGRAETEINSSMNERNGTENPSRNCKENWQEMAMCNMKAQTIKCH